MFKLPRYASRFALAALLISTVMPLPSRAADSDYGKVGQPVHLVIGYQPYWTMGYGPAVLRAKELWKKYLPEGSTVEFQIGLQGSVITNNMLGAKQQIGYMGEMPAIAAVTKQRTADLRLVGVLGISKDVCNVFLVRPDAPKFDNPIEGVKWIEGKQFAAARGSCADRFSQSAFKAEKVTPGANLNQSLEVISTNFKAGRVDAAVVWEPTATKLEQEGVAKRVASGVNFNEDDGGFLVMREDLIRLRPDIAKGWLNAELDAQLFVSDPKNSKEVVAIVAKQVTGFTEKMLWDALWAPVAESVGGSKVKLTQPFTFTPDVMALVTKSVAFLHEMKAIDVTELRKDAIMPELTQDVLKSRNLKAPIATISAVSEASAQK